VCGFPAHAVDTRNAESATTGLSAGNHDAMTDSTSGSWWHGQAITRHDWNRYAAFGWRQ